MRRRLAELPVVDAEWEFGPLRFWAEFRGDDGAWRGYYLPLCVDRQEAVLGEPEMLPLPVDAGACARVVLKTCEALNCRPARWTITEPHLTESLKDWLPDDARVRCRPAPDAWREAAGMLSALGGFAPSGIFENTGVTPQNMTAFCNAAAAFYRSRPWKKLPPGMPLLIDPVPARGLPGVVLVTHVESETGLMGLESFEVLEELIGSGRPPYSAWELSFLPRRDLPWEDQRDFERHDWPVAFKKAHPLLVRIARDLPLRHANRDELLFFTFVLLGIAHAAPQLAEGEPVDMNFRGGLGEARFWIVPYSEKLSQAREQTDPHRTHGEDPPQRR